MGTNKPRWSRRTFLCQLGGLGAVLALPASWAANTTARPIARPIPSTGELLPVIGMGSWITFDVNRDTSARNQRVEVLRTFFERGGGLIDSSPMYGFSEEVIGYCLDRIEDQGSRFTATKVWTVGERSGIEQMETSERLWGVRDFDLMQIHNMLDWETHLETLREWKAEGRIRYIGITTSHGRRHEELIRVLNDETFDFVQFTYNILDREAESRLLPLAAERGVAVIINRPFRRGALIDYADGKRLPDWATEIDCENWPQFLLKFIVSHPAVTCAIPATSRVDHMQENMGAAFGRLPDAAMRRRMIEYFENLS